jgi:hypothetical protein
LIDELTDFRICGLKVKIPRFESRQFFSFNPAILRSLLAIDELPNLRIESQNPWVENSVNSSLFNPSSVNFSPRYFGPLTLGNLAGRLRPTHTRFTYHRTWETGLGAEI